MNNILSLPWIEPLGWTLLHSLWQGLLIWGLMFLALQAVPGQRTKLRHGVAVVSLALLFGSTVTTFLFLSRAPLINASPDVIETTFVSTSVEAKPALLASQLIDTSLQWLQLHLNTMVLVWFAGFVLFASRLLIGFGYVHHLRNIAQPIAGHWLAQVGSLADRLRIKRAVVLAEAPVHAPIVIGYLKPMIVFPLGMISGLTTEQVESILIHELTHIQRHDYLVNLFQAFMEALFFFNPFSWMISNAIHREREHLCDDTVLALGNSPLVYAQTLAQLEEARPAQRMALGLGGKKNQLLNRIKRIMETSARKEAGKVRLVPIAILLLGLFCISWLGIQRSSPENQLPVEDQIAAVADTAKDKTNAKSAVYERRHITRWDENGKPHEEIVESFEGDSAVFGFPAMPGFPDMPDFPDFPDFPGAPAPFAAIPNFPNMPNPPDMPADDFAFFFDDFDSLPRRSYRSEEQWLAFEEEFISRFKDKFGDFYSRNSEELDRLMEDAKRESMKAEEFKLRALEESMASLEESMRSLEQGLPQLQGLQDHQMHQRDMERMQRDFERQEKDMQRHAQDMRRHEEDMKRHERDMKAWEANAQKFESEMKTELEKDGYLKKDEQIRQLSFGSEGDIEVNGKKVKEKDKAKYKELHKKYFKNKEKFHHIEE